MEPIYRMGVYCNLVRLYDCFHRTCELREYLRIMEQTYSEIVKLGPDISHKATDLILAYHGIDEIIEHMTDIPLIIECLKIENLNMMQKFILELRANKNE